MDENESRHAPNPRLSANIVSRAFFCWLWPIFAVGKNKNLQTKDLYEVLPENRSEYNNDALEKNWMYELENVKKNGKKVSFFRALWRTFKWKFFGSAYQVFLGHLVFQTIEPIAVGLLILHFDQKSTSSTKEAYVYATIFIITRILGQLVFNHQLLDLRSVGVSARVASSSLIYRKILRLSDTEKQANSGRIINLLSNDAARLELFFLFLHTLWVLPLQTLLLIYLIWYHVGVASFAGIGLLLALTVPVFGLSGRVIAKFRRKVAMRTDDRIMLLGEIIRGIRLIKMYAWEKPFERFVFLARRYEMDVISTAAHLKNFLFAVSSFSRRIPLYVTIIIYVLQENVISAYTIFTLIQYFNLLDVLLSSYFMRFVNLTSEGLAAMKRIKEFLVLQERTHSVKYLQSQNEDSIVTMRNVSVASTESPTGKHVLDDINISIKRRSFCTIVGPVGAGKSLLLKLLLDEVQPLDGGQICVFGEVSYASQEPWLFKGTIKENILFGEVYDEDRYQRVTMACALLEDFERLRRGDETVVGETGSALSGGQCARVSLARAVYRNADVYLLDDPLSAVDSRVGKLLLDDCINGLLKDKTRILITHRLNFLKESNEIIILDNGCVEYQGNFANLEKTEKLIRYLNLVDETEKGKEDIADQYEILRGEEKTEVVKVNNEKDEANEEQTLLDKKKELKKAVVNKDEEKIPEVTPRKYLYWKYFTACGSYTLPILTCSVFAIAQLLNSGSDYFIAYWSKHQKVYINGSNASYSSKDNNYNLHNLNPYVFENIAESKFFSPQIVINILLFFTFFIIIISIAKTSLCTIVLNKCNERIHNLMATSLIRAELKFYEANDSGRILNRFSKDMGAVDERLRALLVEAIEYAFVIVGIMTQIIIINNLSIIVIFFLGYIFYIGRTIVVKTTKEMMRLDGETKSPVLYHVNSTLTGRLTIRACQAQVIVSKKFDNLQDDHTAAAGLCQYSLVGYSFWLDCVTLSFMSIIVYGLLYFKNNESSGADIGLAITQLITLTGIMARGIKLTGDLDTQMISTKRLFQYTEVMPEHNSKKCCQKLLNHWPSNGEIQFTNLSLRYYLNDTIILKNLSFTLEAGKKIGIVGRTGSGKSSLISALFRLARIEGLITIDDVDTQKVELKDLRRNISILPQEPILFPVTLRKNLDPLEKLDDSTIWSALREVELHNTFSSLDMMVNQLKLSTGQRQLLCLARVILKKNKIVILDEATANVDDHTDSLIQKAIRDNFKDCTVLTISHRLNTIKDMDKIIVMDNGRVVEYDRPEVLMRNCDGHFSKLISYADRKV